MTDGAKEGYADVLGYRLFYRSFGHPHRGTVLGLHGGPGASQDYLLPLADLAEDGYRVVLFDLLGCGRSDLPSEPGLFTLAHNVEEVEGVRRALGLGPVHLMGSSYGGLLALAYAIRYPEALRSLTTIGGLASVPFASREMARLTTTLPPQVQATLATFGARGEFQAPEYLRAVEVFYRNFLCRMDPWPPELVTSLAMCARRPVYAEMNGPNEFTITGTIRDIDLTGQLSGIRAPAFVLGGRFDEVTPAVAEQIRLGIPGAIRVEFPRSSHLPFWEERSAFRHVVAGFLGSVDPSPSEGTSPG
ncbi:MAG TPA: proline iminopeptidase-family hydrolase [Thermoplasmata archaeon]|nr:proline iminopeptidase-family hydrolase [Thermoplasmata archaeon]